MTSRSTRPTNRRSRGSSPRNHLLDVQIRTSTARRRRHEKIGRWVFNILLVALIGGTLVFGMKAALEKFFYQNTDYTLHRITLNLDDILTREEALSETGLQEGVNIFSVDLSHIRTVLQAIPQVADVRIERELPDQLTISLTSRQPVAWIAEGQAAEAPTDSALSLMVDHSGFLMRPRHVRPEYFHLPVIYGIKSDNIRTGEPLENEDLRVALALIDAAAQHPESLLQIRTLDTSKGYCLDVVNDTNAHIIFATSDFEGQLSRLQQLLTHCSETGRALQSVNLMVRRNTPVTFVVASSPEPQPAKASAPTSSKTRRN